MLRHGQTAHNAAGIYQGHTDTELSAAGREQARKAGAALRVCSPQQIVCSDLRRAKATAQAVALACGSVVQVEPALREIDVGAWAGLSHDEVNERYPEAVSAMSAGEDVRRGEYGETSAEVASRTAAVAVRTVSELKVGQSAVLVGHGFASWVMTAHLMRWSTDRAREVLSRLENGRWGELAWNPQGWELLGWNLSEVPTGAG